MARCEDLEAELRRAKEAPSSHALAHVKAHLKWFTDTAFMREKEIGADTAEQEPRKESTNGIIHRISLVIQSIAETVDIKLTMPKAPG